ncbi:MAG: glycosyltransferase [Rhizobiaceae bacterium]|nr:glycosyltransferase [Rhizobiaceae bacterium]
MTRRQRLIWTRLLDPLTYWRSGSVVAASEGLAHEIITANPWAASRVLAIEGTVEAAALVEAAELPVERELQALMDCETVVTFGRLHVQKGYDVLLSAFSRVRAQRPSARLLVIGAGPEEARLRILAGNLGLRVDTAGAEADVILPGLQPNPLRYLQVGRVFVLPSRFEGLPNALIEALASGVDILASDCPWGPRSILSAGGLPYEGLAPDLPLALPHGVLMPLPDAPNAVQVWTEEIARALGTPARPRLCRADRLAAVARYDIARTGPRWLDLARSMTQEAGPR